MAFKDWDDRGRWSDDSECIVCKASMGKSEALICSATCEDVWLLKSQRALGGLLDEQESVRWEGWERENDCYA